MNDIDKRLLAYKPISITLNFDWENTTLDQRAQMRWDYIQEQKKKNPNYVGWDFIEFHGSLYGPTKELEPCHLISHKKLISTIGQTVSIWKNEIYTTFGSVSKDGYCYFHIKKNNKDRTITGHRIVASTFIPVPEELKSARGTLIINHKNDIKHCNYVTNLEWDTQTGNCRKAIQTGAVTLTRFKLTVEQPCELYGKEYFFGTQQDLKNVGLLPRSVYSALKGNGWHLHGTWTEISEEDFIGKPIGIPKEELKILNSPLFGPKKATPYIGTIVTEGPCKGERFVLLGEIQIKNFGFYYYGVQMAARSDNKIYHKCKWVEAARKDAAQFPIGLTEAQKEHIFGKKS